MASLLGSHRYTVRHWNNPNSYPSRSYCYSRICVWWQSIWFVYFYWSMINFLPLIGWFINPSCAFYTSFRVVSYTINFHPAPLKYHVRQDSAMCEITWWIHCVVKCYFKQLLCAVILWTYWGEMYRYSGIFTHLNLCETLLISRASSVPLRKCRDKSWSWQQADILKTYCHDKCMQSYRILAADKCTFRVAMVTVYVYPVLERFGNQRQKVDLMTRTPI